MSLDIGTFLDIVVSLDVSLNVASLDVASLDVASLDAVVWEGDRFCCRNLKT